MTKVLTAFLLMLCLLVTITLAHIFIMYLIANPIPFKITAWLVVSFGLFRGLKSAVNKLVDADWLDNSFKSKPIKK
jgi:hypothetical protein